MSQIDPGRVKYVSGINIIIKGGFCRHTAEAEKTRNGLKYTLFRAAVLLIHSFYNPRL